MRILIIVACCCGVIMNIIWSHAGDDSSTSVSFSFDNRKVNQSLIALYEDDPDSWSHLQLPLIGMCFVYEQQLTEAQNIFELIRRSAPDDFDNLVALGNVYHMAGKNEKAETTYSDAWTRGHNTIALKQLAVLRLQMNDMANLSLIVDDLIANLDVHVDVKKVLLAYCLAINDFNRAGPIISSVASNLDETVIRDNPDLRQLLILATLRFKDNIETLDSTGASGFKAPELIQEAPAIENVVPSTPRETEPDAVGGTEGEQTID